MSLVLGLGNPGPKYRHTRHNVGFDAIDTCAAFSQVVLRKRCFRPYESGVYPSAQGESSMLVKPLTFMNRSGMVCRFFKPALCGHVSDLVVVCDNLDLPPGMIRIRQGGSSAGHNGLKSLIDALGSSDFIRIYVGIGRPVAPVSVVEHVLTGPADPHERMLLDQGILLASQAVADVCNGRTINEVMRAYNRKNIG